MIPAHIKRVYKQMKVHVYEAAHLDNEIGTIALIFGG
jgi:hypothetical protein